MEELLVWLKNKQEIHEETAKRSKDSAAKLNHESRALAFFEVIAEIKSIQARILSQEG